MLTQWFSKATLPVLAVAVAFAAAACQDWHQAPTALDGSSPSFAKPTNPGNGGGGDDDDGGGGGGSALFTIVMERDIQTADSVKNVELNSKDPLKQFKLADFPITFPDSTTGEGCTDTVNSWDGYAGGTWVGELDKNQKGKTHHLDYQATRDGSDYINLAVNHEATKHQHADVDSLVFDDAKAWVGATSSSDGSTTDDRDRCVDFVLKAIRQ